MKYLRVVGPGTAPDGSYGILDGDTVRLLDGSPLAGTARETGVAFPLAEITRFLPPVEPPNVIALGLNYREHARETGAALPPAPVIFIKATTALLGHGGTIRLPKEAPDEVDYEAELVVVIGKAAKNVAPEAAAGHIFGYTCGNDVSARDCQIRIDKQWARGKSFDTFAPVGPWIETDLDPSALPVRSRVNGAVMQDSTTADLVFDVPAIVSYLSRQMTLLPGTLIMTGTPPGVGHVRRPPVFLRPGDTVEIEIEGIGALRNTVAAE